jgi:hypothetical protein
MDYKYLIEEEGSLDVTMADIVSKNSIFMLNILCYHVNTDIKYPFLQFMLEKLPYCYGLIKEQFVLPSIMFTNIDKTIKSLVIEKITNLLLMSGCDITNITDSMYKGIFFSETEIPYALVNITGIDINYLSLKLDSQLWFGLPTEIMNNQSICNIPIQKETEELFLSNPTLSIINKDAMLIFPIPDVVYSGGEYKEVEFNSIFGEKKREIYANLGENYYFFRDFSIAVKEGGWSRKGGTNIIDMSDKSVTHNKANRVIIDNDYGRYIRGGINRYALFMENPKIIWDYENSEYIKREEREEKEENNCCIIGFKTTTPDVLVKKYNLFHPLSYHELDKRTLGPSFSYIQKSEYCIV